jgi:hypothetical protein
MLAASSWRPHQVSPIRLRQPVGITTAPAAQPLRRDQYWSTCLCGCRFTRIH